MPRRLAAWGCKWGLAVALTCGAAGCASWSSEKDVGSESPLLPPTQTSPDSVVIDTVLVRFPTSATEELSSVWRQCNESVLDLETRTRLDNNGLRAGVILGELPQIIRDQLQTTANRQASDVLEHAGLAADVDNMMRHLQCRAGRRKDLIVKRELLEPMTVLATRDGQRVSGATFERPSLLFDMRAIPHGDGSATVTLTPEIQHGELRQSYAATDFGLRPQMQRSVQVWDELRIEAHLHRGQVLVVTSTWPAKALGSAFFVSNTADRSEERVVLLLRLAETQLDELFAPEIIQQAHALAER